MRVEQHVPTLRSWGLQGPDRRLSRPQTGGRHRGPGAPQAHRRDAFGELPPRGPGDHPRDDLAPQDLACNPERACPTSPASRWRETLSTCSRGPTPLPTSRRWPSCPTSGVSTSAATTSSTSGRLVENPDLRRGDWIVLDDNPLSEESVNVHIPALLERRVSVSFDDVRLGATASSDPVHFEVGGHFVAVLGEGLRIATERAGLGAGPCGGVRRPTDGPPRRIQRTGHGDRDGAPTRTGNVARPSRSP